MAVPKRKTSKSKSKSRKSIWMNKASSVSSKALSLAKSLVNDKSTSFVYSKSLNTYK
uniref:Large ribosomal subunit protein bL32c n=1 Tax=Polysiphonia infestans TaxID=2006978 RepID=A0A1Z1ME96_9FLOR|nr:ribosomal protein L32 [Polysiphonia infestans]ARW64283.1 ribosomal protein L32 [Polysiphonia infestans]